MACRRMKFIFPSLPVKPTESAVGAPLAAPPQGRASPTPTHPRTTSYRKTSNCHADRPAASACAVATITLRRVRRLARPGNEPGKAWPRGQTEAYVCRYVAGSALGVATPLGEVDRFGTRCSRGCRTLDTGPEGCRSRSSSGSSGTALRSKALQAVREMHSRGSRPYNPLRSMERCNMAVRCRWP